MGGRPSLSVSLQLVLLSVFFFFLQQQLNELHTVISDQTRLKVERVSCISASWSLQDVTLSSFNVQTIPNRDGRGRYNTSQHLAFQ